MNHRLLVFQSHLIGLSKIKAAIDCRVINFETDIHKAEQMNAGECFIRIGFQCVGFSGSRVVNAIHAENADLGNNGEDFIAGFVFETA